MNKKTFYIGIVCVVVILCVTAGFFVYKSSTSKQISIHQKCPEDYAENDAGTAEYEKAMLDWTKNYLTIHSEPTASVPTVSGWAEARTKLWSDNNCTVALQRLKMSGKVADLKPYELIDNKIQTVLIKTLEDTLYTSELGFSFYYPNDMYVQNGSDGPDDNYRLLIIPNSYQDNEDQDLTAIVISASLNEPPQTPLEWLRGPYSGADMAKGYSKLDIDGQEAISMNGRNWVTVDTPDNKYQISIATLPGENPSQGLQDEMSTIVNSIVFTK